MTPSLVSTEWLKKHQHDPNLIILDASIPDNTLDQVRIPNARFFDLKNSFSDKDSGLPNMLPAASSFTKACQALGINANSTIIVYDTLGIYYSPRVWWMFKAMGHDDVAVLDGGLPKWLAADYKTENTQETTYSKGNFEARYRPERIKNAKDIATNIDQKEAWVVDARSAGRFYGKEPEPRADLQGGHIPNSLNLPYTEVLKDGQYLPKADLKQIFEKLEVGDRPLIFSCGSGLTACIILLASELVQKNKTSVYDGSWTEWGQLPNVPIAT